MPADPFMTRFRTLLVLGRVSNVPTIWSNCLAAWLLGGGGEPVRLIWLCIGTTFLYVGGMFLNDAFDADFDRQHRAERPIPSGTISPAEVWLLGFGWISLGLVSLFPLGRTTAVLSLILAGCIIVYDAIHKIIALAPLLMAGCRFFLYLVAASAGAAGVTGISVWSGLALASYIVGLSYLARRERTRGGLDHWPLLLLGAPIFLALLVDAGPYQRNGLLLSVTVAGWICWCLRHIFWKPERNISYTVSGLLAGIVLTDLLATGADTVTLSAAFLLFFVAARILQRFIPAT